MATVKSFIRSAIPLRSISYFTGSSAAILRFHSIHRSDQPEIDSIPASISHSEDLFRRQVAMLRKNFNVIDMDLILEHIQCDRPFRRRSVAITFDDGFKNNLTVAAPILNDFGIKGTFYAVTDYFESDAAPWFCQTFEYFNRTSVTRWTNPLTEKSVNIATPDNRNSERRLVNAELAKVDHQTRVIWLNQIQQALGVTPISASSIMLSKEELRQLKSTGHIIGSHTHSHPNLAMVTDSEAKHELTRSKAALEALLDQPIVHFCFPNPFHQPHWSPDRCQLVQATGYGSAVTCTPGFVTHRSDQFCLRRVYVAQSERQLRWDLDRLFARL